MRIHRQAQRCSSGTTCRREPGRLGVPDTRLGVPDTRLAQNLAGVRPMPLHCSRDLGHGPGAGSGLLPQLPPPTCSRPVSSVGLGLYCMRFCTAVSRPLLSYCSSLCDLRLMSMVTFVSKRMLLSFFDVP
jgi:hypothetical protein